MDSRPAKWKWPGRHAFRHKFRSRYYSTPWLLNVNYNLLKDVNVKYYLKKDVWFFLNKKGLKLILPVVLIGGSNIPPFNHHLNKTESFSRNLSSLAYAVRPPKQHWCLPTSLPGSSRTTLFQLSNHPGILVLLHLITEYWHPEDFNSLKALRYSGQLLSSGWLKTKWGQTGKVCVCTNVCLRLRVCPASFSVWKQGNPIPSNAVAALSTNH